jgi:hypothetical protein
LNRIKLLILLVVWQNRRLNGTLVERLVLPKEPGNAAAGQAKARSTMANQMVAADVNQASAWSPRVALKRRPELELDPPGFSCIVATVGQVG